MTKTADVIDIGNALNRLIDEVRAYGEACEDFGRYRPGERVRELVLIKKLETHAAVLATIGDIGRAALRLSVADNGNG